MTRSEPAEAVPWSSWRPEGRENQYPDEIAEHVASAYRLAERPAARRRARRPGGGAQPADSRRRDPARPPPTRTLEDEIEVVEIGSGVGCYTLCGIGDRCSIAEGESTPERVQLLRREALELALYTFTYVDGVDSVIALLPVELGDPATEEDDSSTAVFLQKKDFAAVLDRPLREPLGTTAPVAGGLLQRG